MGKPNVEGGFPFVLSVCICVHLWRKYLIHYNPRVIGSAYVRLDSSHPRETTWPCAPSRPKLLLRCDNPTRLTSLYGSDGVIGQWMDPFDALQWLEQHIRTAGPNARWIGYLSYDLGRLFEVLPSAAKDDLGLPLFVFALVENPEREGETAAEPDLLNAARLGRSLALPRSNFSRGEYLAAVSKAIDYIGAGDVFQVNLAQRFTAELQESPSTIYQRLLDTTPAWYGGLLDFGDHALISNSPELFLRVNPDPVTRVRRVITRPIKGTRPRQPGMDVTLRDSIKDQAELNMIVDLERNDLGRVCRIGSVRVSEPRSIEPHPTVFHGVATIEGLLRDEVSFVDLLRATFPGGSVTGAPKIRAMQIIDELEPVRRGPYCGAIGYLASDGRMEFNVAIRTMIVKDGLVHIPVGGGIVADSDPAAEYEETLVKARAMFAALGLSLPQ
jgi:para-aminobenzoate synthetase component 1